MKRNFTLVEILGVVALVAILGTIGFAGYSFAMNRGKESATQAMITRLAAALESAREREGFLPDTKKGSTTPPEYIFVPITVDLSNQEITINGTTYSKSSAKQYQQNFYKDFMKSIQGDSLGRHLNDAKQVTDGWGGVIYYRYPGIFNKGGFDLISGGSDGKFGKDSAATPSSTISDYRKDGEMNCDDIGNF